MRTVVHHRGILLRQDFGIIKVKYIIYLKYILNCQFNSDLLVPSKRKEKPINN